MAEAATSTATPYDGSADAVVIAVTAYVEGRSGLRPARGRACAPIAKVAFSVILDLDAAEERA
jgi:hypothetical protein